MNPDEKKTFDNTSSSYLSLKAELLRKKQDIQRASSSSISSTAILDNLQSTSSSLKLKTKPDLDIEVVNPSKKKKKTEEIKPPTSSSSTTTTTTLSREDEIAYAKSRAILEAKSKLYDEIMSNSEMKLLAEDDGDDDNDKSFLVDFERKIYETNQNNNKIEYTDSFGRTRLVTSDEYEQLKASEKKKSYDKVQSTKTENEIERVERLHREQMRSKWESEMEALRNKTHLHYQDILFDEKREHGVGYYNFSTDDKQRAEQMTTLNELRTNTKIEQTKFIQEKEKRQSNMAERLNKIRLRKAKEMGINLPENNLNNNQTTLECTDKSQLQSDIKSSINTKEEIVEPVSLEKNEEKSKELNHPNIIQSTKSQLSEQTLQTAHTQHQQPSFQNNNPTLQNSNASFAYPFPVLRASNTSSSTSNNHNLHSSNKH
ncbi:unnamed protein product [Rotaria sp. Silwood2]|nr:unnamed protein product [Rotaria sp. Silwood2]CAF3041218.1 unnamed protein product [Rotaria sp. Silwood2]CAF3984944.1 unnamed protein product [Rotaria sp. Silwood2]CAF4367222.1 unnamed protein product [Rotaria sp. Silwood2]